jgi:hypothetical protein
MTQVGVLTSAAASDPAYVQSDLYVTASVFSSAAASYQGSDGASVSLTSTQSGSLQNPLLPSNG